MALTDIVFYNGDEQNIVLALPSQVYTGMLTDILDFYTGYMYKLILTGGGGATDFAYGG